MREVADLSLEGIIICIDNFAKHTLGESCYAVLLFHPSGDFCFREGGLLMTQASLEDERRFSFVT